MVYCVCGVCVMYLVFGMCAVVCSVVWCGVWCGHAGGTEMKCLMECNLTVYMYMGCIRGASLIEPARKWYHMHQV